MDSILHTSDKKNRLSGRSVLIRKGMYQEWYIYQTVKFYFEIWPIPPFGNSNVTVRLLSPIISSGVSRLLKAE